ncbi:MAG: peptidase S14 [Caulobacteraceae bacterium]
MPLDDATQFPVDALMRPHVRLFGDVNEALFSSFRHQVEAAGGADPLVVELTTCGGEAETGRRMALEIRLIGETTGRRILFLGKTVVYSAGVTIMAAFPRRDRYLSRDTVLLVHGRRMDMNVHFTGPLKAQAQVAREMLAQIEVGLELERAGFAQLVEESDVSLDEVCDRAASNWYVPAEEALRRGLVAGLI